MTERSQVDEKFEVLNATDERLTRPKIKKLAPSRTKRQEYAARFNAAIQKSVAGIIEAGQVLLEAKRDLGHGEFLKMVREDLRFGGRSPRMAQMLMRIARHPIISNTKFIAHFPPSSGTLHDLTDYSDRELKELITQGLIHPGLKRREVPGLLRQAIDNGTGTPLEWLLSRMNTMIGYTEKWPDAEEVVERLWVIRDDARRHVQDREPTEWAARPSFTGSRHGGDMEDLHTLTQWLKAFHDAWKRKLEREEAGQEDRESQVAAEQRRGREKDERERQRRWALDMNDLDAVGSNDDESYDDFDWDGGKDAEGDQD